MGFSFLDPTKIKIIVLSAPNKRCLCRSYPPELCKLLGTVIRYCGLPKNFLNLLANLNQKQWDKILVWFSFSIIIYTDWNVQPGKGTWVEGEVWRYS